MIGCNLSYPRYIDRNNWRSIKQNYNKNNKTPKERIQNQGLEKESSKIRYAKLPFQKVFTLVVEKETNK